MLTKNTIRFIRSLEHKKYREMHHCFVAEGAKMGEALLESSLVCQSLYALPEWLSGQPLSKIHKALEINEISEEELAKISFLKTPNQVLLVMKKPAVMALPVPAEKDVILALDEIQDPGNLGTIIRLANWFGIKHVICSNGTADVYNPKTVQSTMGSIINVTTHTTDLYQYLSKIKGEMPGIPIFGTFLDGDDLYENPPVPQGIIVMGNESRGISPQLSDLISHRLFIPCFEEKNSGIESLNVSIATAIICSEFRRLARKLQ